MPALGESRASRASTGVPRCLPGRPFARQKPAPASPPPRSPSLSVSARQRRSSLPPAACARSQPRGGRTHVAPSCWSRLRSPGADAALALSPWPPRPAPPVPGPRQMLGTSERDTASGTLSRGLCLPGTWARERSATKPSQSLAREAVGRPQGPGYAGDQRGDSNIAGRSAGSFDFLLKPAPSVAKLPFRWPPA